VSSDRQTDKPSAAVHLPAHSPHLPPVSWLAALGDHLGLGLLGGPQEGSVMLLWSFTTESDTDPK
jgi:hypothetical protein